MNPMKTRRDGRLSEDRRTRRGDCHGRSCTSDVTRVLRQHGVDVRVVDDYGKVMR